MAVSEVLFCQRSSVGELMAETTIEWRFRKLEREDPGAFARGLSTFSMGNGPGRLGIREPRRPWLAEFGSRTGRSLSVRMGASLCGTPRGAARRSRLGPHEVKRKTHPFIRSSGPESLLETGESAEEPPSPDEAGYRREFEPPRINRKFRPFIRSSGPESLWETGEQGEETDR